MNSRAKGADTGTAGWSSLVARWAHNPKVAGSNPAGNGMVFNPGERILGTTAPGHALIAGALYSFVGKQRLPSVMSALGCLGWTAQAGAVFVLLFPVCGHRGAMFVAACLAVGAAGASSWVALETTLVLGCTLWTMVLAMRDRWLVAALLAAVAGLLRPDAFVVPILLAPMAVWRLRGGARWPALVLAGVSAPWLLFATAYYGSPMPHTAATKLHATDVAEYAQHLMTLPTRVALGTSAPWAVAMLWLLASYGTWRLARVDRRLLIIPAYAVAHSVAYLYLRPNIGHGWHLHPSVTILVVLALVAIAELATLSKTIPRPIIALLLVGIVGAFTMRTGRFAQRYETEHWFGGRDTAYHQAAQYLLENSDPSDLVTSFEVGTLGYVTEREMYDWAGLTTPAPTFPSHRPNERWFVVDDGSLHVPTEAGYQHAATFRHGSFTAYVFDAKPLPSHQ